MDGESPELIDEWNIVPEVWDAVRRKCDETSKKGNYILTCSAKLKDDEKKRGFIILALGELVKLRCM